MPYSHVLSSHKHSSFFASMANKIVLSLCRQIAAEREKRRLEEDKRKDEAAVARLVSLKLVMVQSCLP